MAAAIALAALVPGAANAAVFTLAASTTDPFSGQSVVYQGNVTTGAATTGTDGDTYQILDASGTASIDAMTNTIIGASGFFTLAGGAITSIESYFTLDGSFGGGSIQNNAKYQFIVISEVGGPVTSLSLTLQPISPVPELAGWALMTIGFGTLGLALRGARRTRVRFA